MYATYIVIMRQCTQYIISCVIMCKTSETSKKTVKKLFFAMIHVSDKHKSQQLCEEVVSKNLGMMQFIRNCFKTPEMSENAVAYYTQLLECVPDSYITQEMCQKAVHTYLFSLIHISNCFKTQKDV